MRRILPLAASRSQMYAASSLSLSFYALCFSLAAKDRGEFIPFRQTEPCGFFRNGGLERDIIDRRKVWGQRNFGVDAMGEDGYL